jgi:hypothetical protein
VDALCVYNGNLYAGGIFTTAGGVSASKIAMWNDSIWSPLGTGVTSSGGTVKAMAVFNGDLYVGGSFSTVGGVSAANIAKWNGTTWSAIASGTSAYVASLYVYNGALYAGGAFVTANGVSASKIAKWDGTIWTPMDSGMGNIPVTNSVLSITEYNSELYAAGSFTTASGNYAHRVALWNTSIHAGIDEYSLSNSFGVYPNPFSSATTLVFDKEFKNAAIKVINVLGKTVKTINFSGTQATLQKEDLAPGIYFAQLITHSTSGYLSDEIISTKKIIVQ